MNRTYLVSLEDDEVLVALKRGEGYEDVHPELVSADAIGDRWPEYRTLGSSDLTPTPPDPNDFPLGKACDLSKEDGCEACQ